MTTPLRASIPDPLPPQPPVPDPTPEPGPPPVPDPSPRQTSQDEPATPGVEGEDSLPPGS